MMNGKTLRRLQRMCRAVMAVVTALMLVCSLMPASALSACGVVPHADVAVAADKADGSGGGSKASDGDDDEAAKKAAEEAERKAKEEAEQKAKEEAERKAKEEAERKAKEEAERKAKEEAERKAAEEAARKAAEEEAARKAAEEKARQEAEQASKPGSSSGSASSGGKRTLEDMDIYVTATNSYGEWGAELDRKNKGTRDKPEWWLKDGIKEKGGQVKLLVYAYWSGGRACRQDDRDNWIAADLEYKSSNKKVATVSNSGIITATGDGDVEISVTDRGSGVSASIFIRVSGQVGALVQEVWVTDATGRQYEEERIVYNDFTNPLPLYVREVFSDGATASNAPQAPDYAPDKLTEVSWSVNNDMAKISAGEGTLTATQEAREAATTSVTVTVSATGGDPDVMEGVVRSHAYVRIQGSGTPKSGHLAADSLTVNVIYDAYPDYTVATKTFTLDQLKALQTTRSTYTMTRSSGEYVTASGEGVYLTTLISQMNLKNEQVKSFTFTANDGVNPGKMTYSFLFGERYWWPNYEFGGNRSEAQSVFPMLAWASDWRESKSGATNCDADYSNLNDNSRLRLLFGSETNSDNKTDHSLKYISAMTIRIDGAPDVTNGTDEQGESADPIAAVGDNQNTGDAPGDNGGAQNGSVTGGTTNPGSGEEPTSDEAALGDASAAKAIGGQTHPAGAEAADPEANPTAAGAQLAQTNNDSAEDAHGEIAGAAASSSSQKWRVYQMMNPFDESDLQIQELNDNPLSPYLPYLLALLLLLGGAERWLNYKRQTVPWPKARLA